MTVDPFSMQPKYPIVDIKNPVSSIEEELLTSIRENKTEKSEELIRQGVSPNHKDHDGNTPIVHAARNKNARLMAILINNGGVLSINWTNNEKKTALMYSAKAGDVDTLRLLLHSGAEVDFQDTQGYTALMMAAINGRQKIVEALLEHGKCAINVQNKWGHTALHDSAKKGHLGIVALLCFQGAGVDTKDRWMNTPLMYATLHGRSSVAAFLLESKCDVNAMNKGSRTALHTASQNGHPRIVELLLTYGAWSNIQDTDDTTPLLLAGRFQQPLIMKKLIYGGCNVFLRDKFGKSSIHYAAAIGCRDLVESLLYAGVHPNVADNHQNTALIFAIRRNHVDIVCLLLQHNCDMTTVLKIGSNSFSVFALALRHGYSEMLPLLVDAGCDTRCFQTWFQRVMISHTILEDDKLLSWLHWVTSNPRPLRLICRDKIRQSLTHKINQELDALPLPTRVKNFILLKSQTT